MDIPPAAARAMGGNVLPGKRIDLNDYIHAKPVQPMKMTLQCPGCLKGELVFTGMSSQTEPKQFQHRCECGYELGVVGKSYPHIAFEDTSLEKPDEDMDETDGIVARIGNEGGGGGGSGSGAADAADPEGRREDHGEDGGRVQSDPDHHPVQAE